MSEAPVPLPDAIPKNLGRVILKALETKKYRYCSAERFKDELLKVKKSLSNEQLKKSLMKDKSGTTILMKELFFITQTGMKIKEMEL